MFYIEKSCHESEEEQKSKGIRTCIDREHDSDNRESTKDERRDYRRNDKRDQKRSDQRDDNSAYENNSDSEEIHGNLNLLKLYLINEILDRKVIICFKFSDKKYIFYLFFYEFRSLLLLHLIYIRKLKFNMHYIFLF